MTGAGDKVGGFSLVRQLGAGGMGETWEAVRQRAHGFEQRVAIKLASRAVLSTKEGLELFRREASLAASLRHPNIACVLDVDEHQGYLIYELIDGADLRSVLRECRGRPSTPMIVYIIAQIARGLAHAHRRVLHGQLSPVVHRDMSPGNVVVDYDGNLKIVDFGIAKATALGERSETVKGKLAYMSPEQIASGGTVDGRVDQYALGVIAYEAVAGVRPNDGAHDGETLAKILHGDHVPVTKRAPEVPAGLGELIERMIAVKPDDRFESMDAVIDALAAFNPPLTTHRELAALVHRANPPQTIVLRDGAFVSVPVAAREALASQPPRPAAVSGLNPRAPAGLPANVATESLVRAEPLSPRSDIGQAQTVLAEERSPGATALPLEVAARATGPTDGRSRRLRYPLYAAAAALAVGLVGWLMPGRPLAFLFADGGMNGALPSDKAASVEERPSQARVAASPPPAAPISPTPAAPMNVVPASPASAPAATPTSTPAPTPEAAPAAAAKTGRARRNKREEPAATKATAKVRVRVFPWGRVWIDGNLRGSAPPILVAELSPGTHDIAVGHEKPIETKRVTLDANEDEVVAFDLEEK